MHVNARHRRPLCALVGLLTVATVTVMTGTRAVSAVEPPAGEVSLGSRFVPVQPCRLADTRAAPTQPAEPPAARAELHVEVAGECDVADGAVAAALTVTAVDPRADGYVTMFPAGADRPTVSTVNYRPGQVVANLALTRLGDDGAVTVFTLASAHVVVDVTGYFEAVPEGEQAGAGRFVPLAARRILDTRTSARPAAGAAVAVDTTAAGVPADAGAVVVNLTTDQTNGADVFTAFPAGSERPTASVLNVDRANQTRAAATIVPATDGRFEVFTRNGNHVIVDLLGYFTGASAEASDDGLFVPIDPFRMVDTRQAAGANGGPRLWDGGGREFPVEPAALGAPAGGFGALAVNTTLTGTEDAGWVSLAAAGAPVPGTSTVNAPTAQATVANAAIVGVSERGLQPRTLSGTHVVLDVSGWFTGAPVAAAQAAPSNPLPPPRKVTIVGDSVLAGIRWNGTKAAWQGFEPVDEMHSCRRLVQVSCTGREGYRAISALPYIRNLPPASPEEILVIGLGYDDWHTNFGNEFEMVIAAARERGFHHVAWMTLRTDVSYQFSGVAAGTNYAAMNTVLLSKLATGDYPEVRLWDFDGYTHAAATEGWFYNDGVHLRPLGSWAIADWISRHVAAYDDRPCPQPWAPGQPLDNPCPNPDQVVAARGYPDIPGLYLS